MVSNFDTILDTRSFYDDKICIASMGNTKSIYEEHRIPQKKHLGKAIDYLNVANEHEKELELCEPESELDPVSADVLVFGLGCATTHAQLKRSRKNRHASLIDKALKLQEKQLLQGQHSNAQQQNEPIYIWFSDLATDWSRYISKPSLGLMVEDSSASSADVLSGPLAPVAIQVLPTSVKRNRKKSLIDKAASQQRKEHMASYRESEKDINAISAPSQIYCSLCQQRSGRNSCALCGSRP
jgi:hypothetical protein